jgi:DNA-binding transcriptional ArsR family regulator
VTAPFEDATRLDRLVHEPARLAILTALDACASADFLFLHRLTGLTVGNLSAHLAKLAEAQLVTVDKQFIGRIPNTQAAITKEGRAALRRHWRGLQRLRKGGADLRGQQRRSATPASQRLPAQGAAARP